MTSKETLTLEEKVRKAAWLYLNQDEVGIVAGISLAQMQQLAAGAYHPDAAQLSALARRMGIE